MTFDDEAAAPIFTVESQTGPITGSWSPLDSLAALDGEDPNGTWRLTVLDRVGGDAGELRRWQLAHTEASGTPSAQFPFPWTRRWNDSL
jgi:subtilisin-like proprotein convertase family protein